MHLMSAGVALWFAAAAMGGEISVVLRTSDGELKGTIESGAWTMTTSFGSASIELAHVRSVTFGEQDSVVTDDRTVLNGRIALDVLEILTPGAARRVARTELRSMSVVMPAPLTPGVVTSGRSASGLDYYLRAPATGATKRAIVILHGSNMNSRDYVETIVGAWPALADEYIVIGIDGEQEGQGSTPARPVRNYTYVNYTGMSTYKGYPGTDRESPALVSEAIAELRERLGLERVFVGGHSQGAFLTYSLYMNCPGLVDGAFPVSGGLIMQCEPGAYADAELVARQKRAPLAIVHATNDPVVAFSMSAHAHEAFEDAGFPALKLITDDAAAHMFARLPVERAVRWLEVMSSRDGAALIESAERAAKEELWRDALALAARAKEFDAGPNAARISLVERAGAEAQRAESDRIGARTTQPGDLWVWEFLDMRERFGPLAPETPLHAKFAALRTEQDPRAEELFTQANAKFQSGERDAGYELCRRIVDELPASARARLCKRWLSERKER